MKIKDILAKTRPVSFEFFPPRTADGIPAGSTVVAGYGELDCRYKEGIMRVVHNDPARDWRALVDALVPRYVAFVMAEAERRGWTLWLQTPPMSNVTTNLLLTDDRLPFLGIIERFNERLRAEAEAHNLPLIDVKAATTTPERTPRHTHYIDTNHVRPTALIEALRLMTL